MCQNRVLTKRDETIISSCMGCGSFYVWHKNLVLNFTDIAFASFREVVNSIDFEGNSLPFPDGSQRLVLHTPNNDISFAFAEEEFACFRETIDEAMFMNEVYSLMSREP